MRTAGKVWGQTTEVESNSSFGLHRITATAGHKCSKHLHQTKFNGFYVLSGKLQVTVWKKDSGTVDVTVLNSGDWMVVAPGEYHQFEALETTIALELYWVDLNHADIIRDTFGE